MNMPGYVMAETDEAKREHLRHTLTTQSSRHLTICEQLRFVYDDVAEIQDEALRISMTEKLIDAIGMAKKINDRLVFYKKKEGLAKVLIL